MRLSWLLVACALLLSPVGARAAKTGDGPVKKKAAAKKDTSKKKPAGEKTTTNPTKEAKRTLRPGALTVNVGHEINDEAKVTPFPSFAPHPICLRCCG